MRKILSRITSFFANMQKSQRRWLIIFASILIAVLIVVSVVLSQKSYSVLYSQMDPAEAGEVMNALAEMNVDAKAEGDDTIYVADDQIDNARMQLASQGYPNSGVNYDIFQNAAGLGVTDMEKQVYYQFQTQENLRQTIRKLDKVEDAVVNINLEQKSSFVLSDDEESASAAVMLTLKNNATLDAGEVSAIAELVAKSVSGLELDNVRIIDSHMNLYNTHTDDQSENMDSQMSLQQSVQSRLQTQVINLLTPVFGEDNILAEVYVSLNFDTVVQETVEFTPPEEGSEGIVVSMKELVEVIKDDETTSTAVTGVDANGGASSYFTSTDDMEDAVYYQTSREANYEISQTKTMIENARGQIDDLSVSIIINSTQAWDDYTNSVVKLVANAIGVSSDMVTVEMLPFQEMEEQSAVAMEAFNVQQEMLNDAQGASLMRLIIYVAAGLIALIILFSIIRMFSRSRGRSVAATDEGIDVIVDEEIIPDAVNKEDEENIEVNFSKDNNTSFLEEYIDKNPESVANLLRNWLNED